MEDANDQMSHAELRKFGFVTALMVVIFFYGLIPWIWEFARPLWPLVVAGVLVALALVLPGWLAPVYRVWMKIGHALGWVNTRIILSLIFFVLFLPVGLVMRAFGDPMRRKWDDAAQSYRVPSSAPKPDNMEKPF
ncbi:MAG: SxtJ family membrane protein [Halioglobus sp.]|nr:SxtJ family membrane protein [Halioglobus sp.]